MAAPLDMSAPIEIAQASTPHSSPGAEPVRAAQLPPDCERRSVDVTVDAAIRYVLPQIPDVAAFRKQTNGESIVVSTAGHGQLVMDHFVTAAHSAHPPVVVLGDGTVLSAEEVLAQPEQLIARDLCAPRQFAQVSAASDSGTDAVQSDDSTLAAAAPSNPAAPAGDAVADATQVATAPTVDVAHAVEAPRAVPQLATLSTAAGAGAGDAGASAAAAGASAAAAGGEANGAHFNSSFGPSPFDGLAYGRVDPLSFSRTPPVLLPGSGDHVEAPVNDATLQLGDIAAKEDLGGASDQISGVPLPHSGAVPITIAISTPDSAEAITSVTISGVPAGVTFNHGHAGPDGTWLLAPSDLPGLTLTGVPADSDHDFTLTVQVAMMEGGQPLPTLTGTIAVTLDAVADIPTLILSGTAHGNEDTAIALPNITAGLQDSDGSEALTLTIAGVPAGATLSAGTDQGGGVWALTGLTQAQLDALAITPPADYAGSFNLTVTATATEAATVAGGGELQDADNTASTSQSFTVTVDAVRDSTLSVSDTAVKEDLGQAADQIAAVPSPTAGPQPLTINLSLGANEVATSITITGVPAGVAFNNGSAGPGNTWVLTPAELSGLQISAAPSDSDGDFTLGVIVGLAQNGQVLPSLSDSITVTVDAVADIPTLNLTGTATGNEDTAIALPDIATALQDSDGSETLTLSISGVPAGATLSAGTDQGGGVWALTGLTQAQLDALTITPPADFSGSFNLTVSATSTEAATVAGGGELQDADNTATTSQSFTVTVDPVRDSTLAVSDTAIKEDLGQAADQIAAVPSPTAGAQPLAINLSVGANESVTSITIAGVPSGVTFNHGTDNGNGTWLLTQADLTGLTINGAPADSDADFTLGVTVGVSQNGTALPDLTGSIQVTVDAVADVPTLNLTGTASGTEDTAVALPDIAAALQDATGETLTLSISGVPAGATLSAGTDQGGGVWSLTGLSQAQLDALTITPPADFSGSFNLTVTATSTEAATVAGGGELQDADNTASTTQSFAVTVTPARDSTLSVVDTAVKEDLGQAADQIASVPQPTAGAQPLTINLSVGAGETVDSITIAGVPSGVTFNHGTDNGNGTWSLTQADLTGLTINGAPADSDADFALGVTVGVSQNGTALPDLTGSIQVTVDAVADVPTLNLTGTAHGNEDSAIALPDVAAALQDTDGSETLVLSISGVPAGATLSAGVDQGGGVWSLTGLSQAQLDALTITPPTDFSGSFNLTITATATEAATVAGGGELQNADNSASTSQTFAVVVDPVRDSTMSVSDTAIKEDLGQAADQIASVPQPTAGAQALTINLSVGANESITSITLSGVPAGVTFNHGTDNGNGTWSLTQADLTGLTLNGAPADSDADYTLGVSVGVSQNGTALPDLTGSIQVTVDAVADIPTLNLTGTASGDQATAIALPDITAALQDATGETLTLTISGVPAGATLSAGTNQGGGVWDVSGLSQAQLNALTITPAANTYGDFNLTVTATAHEGATVAGGGELTEADNTAATSQSFQLHVNALPSGGSASTVVSEAGIEAVGSYNAGTQSAGNSEIASGSLGYSFGGDGQAASGAFTWSGTVGATDPDGGGSFSGLTSHGETVVWTVSPDGFTLTGETATSHETVATLTITNVATGAYTYEQIGTFDHPDVGQTGAADLINLGFGYTIKDGTGDTTTGSLTVGVQDDAPIADPVAKFGTEGTSIDTNLLVVLDISGSMNDPSGLTDLTRLDVAKAAVTDLIEQYDNLGDVRVHIVTFSTGATDGTGVWVSASQAITYLDSLAPGGTTNYDAALATAESAFGTAGKLSGAENVAYFMSDGQPNQPVGSAGIDSTEQASWESFLDANGIKTYALGMGTGVNDSALQPIAYDGIAHGDIAPVVVSDMSQLSQTLTDTIPSQAISGSILTDSVSTFGADGGHVLSLTVDGTSYSYDPSAGGSIAVSGTDHHTFDTVTDTLTVTTDNGSTIAINMDTGAFVYTAPGAITSDLSEVFNYTLFDSEGDTASSTMTFNVQNIDQPPEVNTDRIITSIAGSDAAVAIPDWALTANDSDPDGDAIAVTGTSNASGGTAGHAATTTTFTDVGTDGGTFDYTGTANGQTDTGHVIVDRAQAGSTTLNGTGLGEILIGQTGDDTINGFEGNDILIGNGGIDSLLGGAGSDILVFEGVASTYDGGSGFDTLRIADSLSGTIDLRSGAFNDAQIENIDHLALDGGNDVTVRLDYQAVVDMEPGSNSLRITGDAGDTINLSEPIAGSGSDKWIKTASDTTTDTYTYTPSNGANPVATLVVDHQMTVT